MGRELKRVALDFKYPENKVWEGYLNPYYSKQQKCQKCDGSGYSPKARNLKDQWYGYVEFYPEDRGSIPFSQNHPIIQKLAERNTSNFPYLNKKLEAARLAHHFNERWMHHLNTDDITALINKNRLMDFTHSWTKENGWKLKDPIYTPTPTEVNEWSLCGFGHDSINCSVVIDAECEKLKISPTCEFCQGEGYYWNSLEDKKAYEEWQPKDPPEGEGYQIWETVSEGSPISPVFATPEELAKYMENKKWGADKGSSYETWLKFIKGPGWALSMILDDKGLRSGVEAV
jgi:hypothetical protein